VHADAKPGYDSAHCNAIQFQEPTSQLPWKSLDCERRGKPREVQTQPRKYQTLHTKPFVRAKATTPQVFADPADIISFNVLWFDGQYCIVFMDIIAHFYCISCIIILVV